MGRGIRYLREQKKFTQGDLAIMMGGPWDQKKVSNLEKKQTIDEPTLQLVAEVLEAVPATLRNYSPDGSFSMQSAARGRTPSATLQSQRPAEDVIEDLTSIIKDLTLTNQQQGKEMTALYERLLEAERQKTNMNS